MKTTLLTIICFLSVFFAEAQKDTNLVRVSGIYKTSQDFDNGKLSYAFNCDSSSSKIKLHAIFSTNYIDIISNGNKIRVRKDSIFGYRDCKQKDFRFSKNDDHQYQIMENKDIVIYKTFVSVTSSSGKTTQLVPEYFFSVSSSGEMLPMTLINLKKAFPGNIKFHDMLDVQFGDGTVVSSYDSAHKMYMVNYLLTQSLIK